MADLATLPRPTSIAIAPSAPRKRTELQRAPVTLIETKQRAKAIAFNMPKAEVEETDITDLFTETREKKMLTAVYNKKGERYILFDDGTFEEMPDEHSILQ